MSNFKKVILFVSMIAVLVSSLMLPTFADDADYPLTDPYIEGYNGYVVVDTIDPTISYNSNRLDYQQGWSIFGLDVTQVRIVFKLNNGTSVVRSLSFSSTELRSVVWDNYRRSDGYMRIYVTNNSSLMLGVNVYFNGTVTYAARIDGTWTTVDTFVGADLLSVELRYYCTGNPMNKSTIGTSVVSSSLTSISAVFDSFISRQVINYSIRESVYNNGITAGIEQGYQNGYDEGYQEGFASAGGSFADVVSNPQVGIGIPDIRVQFPAFPSDYLTLGSSALMDNLMKFAHVNAVGESLYDGNGIDVYGSVSEMRWLGTENTDPKKNGWVCTLWNEAQTAILGTLHWNTGQDWEWYEGADATEIELTNPRDILTNVRLDIWVHGDSTAYIDTTILNDNGFTITYPFMGEVFYEDGYNNGYDNGLEDGFNGADTSQAWMNLRDTIFVIFDAPFYVISQSLNFDLFGINIAGAIISIISVALIVFILKIIIVRLF